MLLADVHLAHHLVRAAVPGGHQDGVSLVGIQLAEGDVAQLAAADRSALLQLQIADVCQLVGALYFARVIWIVDHGRPLLVPARARGAQATEGAVRSYSRKPRGALRKIDALVARA